MVSVASQRKRASSGNARRWTHPVSNAALVSANVASASPHRLKSLSVSIETRRGRRNGDDARVRHPKRFDVSESRRVQEQHVRHTRLFLAGGSNRASTQVQLSVSDARLPVSPSPRKR